MEQFSFLLGSNPRTNAFLGLAYKTRHFEKDFIVDVHDWNMNVHDSLRKLELDRALRKR